MKVTVTLQQQMMLRSYKYRLYPQAQQEVRLKRTLALLCDLYEELRNEKVEKYKKDKISLNKTELRRIALEKRRSNEELKQVHSQVVQNVADRVATTFKNFFEKRARFPKNKPYRNYRSFVYRQSGFNITSTLRRVTHSTSRESEKSGSSYTDQ